MNSLLLVALWASNILAFSPEDRHDDCEKAVIVRYQPVVYDCDGTTTESVIRSIEGFPAWFEAYGVDGLETITTTGPIPGTMTLSSLGGDAIVVVTEPPGEHTTITTIGPIPGTTTLPVESGGGTTVVVTVPPGGETTITTTGPTAGTTTLPPGSSDGSATILVTVVPSDVPDDIITTTAPGSEEGTTTLPINTSDDNTSEATTVVVTVPTDTSDESTADPTSADPTEDVTTSDSTQVNPPGPTDTAGPDCPDLENGGFFVNGDGTLPPWYISDQITADSSGVIQADSDEIMSEAAFALIPSQDQFAQVYLNQQLPSCGDPPPEVTLRARFSYEFTGSSAGCRIGASVNRSPDNIVSIEDDGLSPGVWQEYDGGPIQVQLTYDPLFTLKLLCDMDTANQPAILITDISVY